MILTDTHTHLYSEAFDDDQKEMMQRAIDAGVDRFFVPAIDSTYTSSMLQLKKDFPSKVHLMAGLHPTHVKENFKKELAHVKSLLEKKSMVAVGEIGVDLYWEQKYFSQQLEAFETQIYWSLEHNLPIVIHCRDAFDEVFEVLENFRGKSVSGIFHCFTGTLEHAKLAVNLNLKLGIGGVVTFKNGKIDQFLDQINIENIVLETDAPYLAPVPYRGKRNESSYLLKIAEKVAQIYSMSLEEVAQITTDNSRNIFGV
ncbi:hydrolase TatD [Nonlabens spongiae]|uniref:Hydrolase TatD n=1 Tax=Nonlabens spongiae TaxID=331648 RepID=A0A1W6MMH2_9FLAO|nr:TatD family hydrolase [Nonlabens spongiae]ARN78781.1 hydrolase TatD [Nonlabens spongiae]